MLKLICKRYKMPLKSGYDFETNRIIKVIKKRRAKFVGLQFPDGLKGYAVEIADEIEKKTNARTVIFIDPLYGACDTKENEAEMLGLDMIVHFGHTEFGVRKN